MRLFQALAELLPMKRKAYVRLWDEPANLSASATVASVQSAIRSAEAGETRDLFALYRDLTSGGSHIQAECNKRKLAMLAQPHSLLPADKANADDLAAVEACARMISDCENWTDGLTHLLDSHAIWPVTVVEKIFAPTLSTDQPSNVSTNLSYTLRRLEPVNPTLLCFRQSYARQTSPASQTDPTNTWESELRFWPTDADGRILYNFDQAYSPERERHIVHRGHLLVGQRDCWGGPGRAIVFWWLLSTLGRDWFARAMERYGVPFPVGHTDAKDQEAISFLQEAFSLSTKIGGLVVDHDTQIELKEVAISGLADGHEKFLNICNREISKVVVGQTLSSEAAPTGLGSGTADLQAGVREDIRMFDQLRIGETIRQQLFAPFLRINGLRGTAPKIVWGGLSDEDAATFATLLQTLSQAGFEPTDEAVPTVSERIGFEVQRKAPAPAAGGFGGFNPDTDIVSQRRLWLDQYKREQSAQSAETLSALKPRLLTLQAQSRMADTLGVPAAWLNPVRDFLEELQAKADDGSLNERDLLDFLDRAVARVPELFGKMDVDSLAEVLEAGMGEAVLSAARRGTKKQLTRLSSEDDEGRGVTINGNAVFIKDGESVEQALSRDTGKDIGGDKGEGGKSPENKGESATKTETKSSPSEAKSGNIKESNERREKGESGTGKRDRLVESASSSVGASAERNASHDEPTAQRDARNREERGRLYDWAEENGKLIEKDWAPSRDASGEVIRGGEHEIQFKGSGDNISRVFKSTRPDVGYGSGIALNSDARGATPAEYLDRIQLLNQEHGTQIKLEGVKRTSLGPRIITSMPYVPGVSASDAQVTEALAGKGYTRLAEGTYYHRDKKLLMHDVYGRNAKFHNGKVYLIDAVIQRSNDEFADFLPKSGLLRQ